MLSSRLIRTVSDHWEDITRRVIGHIRQDAKVLQLGKYPEPDLRQRAREILQNLGPWLVSREKDLAARYERLGRVRFEEGVPLHELVHALQLIKLSMIEYLSEQGLVGTPLEVYAEAELQRGADGIFDLLIYYVVRGYERAMRETPEQFGASPKRPTREPEFAGPLPF